MIRSLTKVSFIVVMAAGCHRAGNSGMPSSSSAPAASSLTPGQIAARKLPVLARTLSQQELDQLFKYMTQYQAENGKYPSSMNDLKALGVPRDLPRVAQAVENGDLVLAGGTGGVLAYEAVALQERGNVLTTEGIQVMTAEQLKKKLGR